MYGAWATFVTAKLRSFVFFDLTSPPMAIGAMVTLKVHWILPVLFGTNWAGSVSPLWSKSQTARPSSLKSSPTVPSNVHVVVVFVSSDPSR